MCYMINNITICGIFLMLLSGQGEPGCASRQGIEGRIVFESGNRMPGPGVVHEPAKGVKRELLVYPLLSAAELKSEGNRSEEHTSALQSLMRISYAVFCLTNKT